MVYHSFPQNATLSIITNSNYSPQGGTGGGGEPTFDDEDYFLGIDRDSTEFLLDAERNSVDFELVL